ncbi:uncharacterized protein PV09_03237 [Verruconis gallopava]|uniref:Zn(2)-C6 fungal-type domain-containing protein n=1 Tax=Verruconis gallopava TaxID=253628 RepID=A0A0D2AHP1_9PEZI|nr:uncharacterized protein PV09_03237 [Verruconis gallopava]KIW06065.1 hypothetical protein PV09_03237 [Verruconis gallopava]
MERSPEGASSKKPPRRYAFACSNCRKKKIRCDGAQPECTSCARAEEVCQYPKKRMEAQLAQAQKRIQELESELLEARSSSPYGSQPASSPGALYSDSEQDYSLYSQVGFDDKGSITYHGPTSRFQESAFEDDDDETLEEAAIVRERLKESSQKHFKTTYEDLQNRWQPLLVKKTEADFGIPTDVAIHLLSAYFTWQNPFHNFVYKPLFIRDLAGTGPYCSRFLLTSIFALAARHCNHDSIVYQDQGERFLVAAKELLVRELGSSRPAIATIQGLLILGCRQCGIGNTSEGWLFSGMARLNILLTSKLLN